MFVVYNLSRLWIEMISAYNIKERQMSCIAKKNNNIKKNRLIGLVGSVRQWSGRPGFNPRSRHTKDFKNGTWYLLA